MVEEVEYVHKMVSARLKLTYEERVDQDTMSHRRRISHDPCFVGDLEHEVARALWEDEKQEAKFEQSLKRQRLRRKAKASDDKSLLDGKQPREKGFQYVFLLTQENAGCLRGVMENIWYNKRWWVILCRHNSSHWDKHTHCAGCYAEEADVVTCCMKWPDENGVGGDDRCEVGKMMTEPQLANRRSTIRTHLNRMEAGGSIRPRDVLNTKVTNIATSLKEEHKLKLAQEKTQALQENEEKDSRGVIRTETYQRLAREAQMKFVARRQERIKLIEATTDFEYGLDPDLAENMRMAQIWAGEIHEYDGDANNNDVNIVSIVDNVIAESTSTQTEMDVWGPRFIIGAVAGPSFTTKANGVTIKQEPSTPLSSVSTLSSGVSSDVEDESGQPWNNKRNMPHFLPSALLENRDASTRRGYTAYRPDSDPMKQQILGEIKIFNEHYKQDVRVKLSREMQVKVNDALEEMGNRMLNDTDPRPLGAPAMPYDTVVDRAWCASRYDTVRGGFYTGSLQFPQVIVKNKANLKIDTRFNISHVDIGYLEQVSKYNCMACARQEMFIEEERLDLIDARLGNKRLERHLNRIGRMESENRRMMACAVELVSYILFLRRREFLVNKKGMSRTTAIAYLAQPIDPDHELLRDFEIDG